MQSAEPDAIIVLHLSVPHSIFQCPFKRVVALASTTPSWWRSREIASQKVGSVALGYLSAVLRPALCKHTLAALLMDALLPFKPQQRCHWLCAH